MAYTGSLYQLEVSTTVTPYVGMHVLINGPWDTYGRIVKINENGFHLIRGIPNPEDNKLIYGTSTKHSR